MIPGAPFGIPNPPTAPATRPVLVAHEGDVTAGALSVKDAYDLKLWRMPDGSYDLVIFMKLQFFFESGEMQRGAVHEFGHMLGLDDEYPASSPNTADKPAVMNSGEQMRPRYNETLLTWTERKLKALGIQ